MVPEPLPGSVNCQPGLVKSVGRRLRASTGAKTGREALQKFPQAERNAAAILSVAQYVKRRGKHGENNNTEDNGEEIPIDVRNETPEEVPCNRQSDRPEEPAEDVVGEETRIAHGPHPGENRREGSDDGEKAGQDNGFSSVACVEPFGTEKVLAMEEQRILPGKNSPTHAMTEGVPH